MITKGAQSPRGMEGSALDKAPSIASSTHGDVPHAHLRDQALRGALLERADLWKAAAERARRLMSGRAQDITDATRMVDDYRLLAHDLARARRLMPNSRAREFLEAAYAQAHTTLHKPVAHLGY